MHATTMRSFALLTSISAISLVLSWCGITMPWSENGSWSVQSGTNSTTISGTVLTGTTDNQQVLETYTVGVPQSHQRTAYGTIIAGGIRNVNTSIAGILQDVACEPGTVVTPDTIIASVIPDTSDTIVKNSKIQATFLSRQIDNLESIISSTRTNFGIQDTTLQNQIAANTQQRELLERNMYNLSIQRDNNADDMYLQMDSLEEQLQLLESSRNNLLDTRETDYEKTIASLENTRTQVKTFALDSADALDQFLWLSDTYASQRALLSSYLWARDSSKKTELYTLATNAFVQKNRIEDMSDAQLSDYLALLSDTLQKTVEVLNLSTSWEGFSATDIATNKAKFSNVLNLSTTYKNSIDGSNAGGIIAQNAYDTQLNTLESNIITTRSTLESLQDNKFASSDISFDTNMNTLQSQIINLELATTNLAQQRNANKQTQAIQLAQLENQLLSLEQNIEILNNTLSEETLTAGVHGVVKARKNDSQNKVPANSAVCQISVTDVEGVTLQFYSPDLLPAETQFSYMLDDTTTGSGSIDRVAPYVDTATQNYIYETMLNDTRLVEGQKLSLALMTPDILSEQTPSDNRVFVPIIYIIPKLEGNFVRVQRNGRWEQVPVTLWQLNGTLIEITNGIARGDIIGR